MWFAYTPVVALVACGDNTARPDAFGDAAIDAPDGVVDTDEGCDRGLRGFSTVTTPTRNTMAQRTLHAMTTTSRPLAP